MFHPDADPPQRATAHRHVVGPGHAVDRGHAWENRPDTVVVDEPLYAYCLAATGLDHPGRDEVIAGQPTDWRAVVRSLTEGDLPDGLTVLAEHTPPVYDTGGITQITSSMRRPSPDVLDPRIHSNNLLNSILAEIEAKVTGADDAILLDGDGVLAETTATRLFCVLAGVMRTSTTRACPEGTTRATVRRSTRRSTVCRRAQIR